MFSEEYRQLKMQIELLERLLTKKIARQSQYPISRNTSAPQIVRFSIISSNCQAKIATVEIESRFCGQSTVTGESGGQLEVEDPMGCLLDEPGELIGRQGWAAYMQDSYGDCSWEMFQLCCDPDVCA